jgi:hypothetical protein
MSGAPLAARESLAGALSVSHQVASSDLAAAAREAFVQGASEGLLVAIAAAAIGALLALRYLPARAAAQPAAESIAPALA